MNDITKMLWCPKHEWVNHTNGVCDVCSVIPNVSNDVDKEYFRLLNTILKNGRNKKDRTGVGTVGVFGEQAKFKVDMNAFPILTTKKVWFKGIVHELLWFIKGDTNIKYLVDNDVHIWDDWAYKKYVDACGSEDCNTQKKFIDRLKSLSVEDSWVRTYGELGEGTYGSMWRAFPHFNKIFDANNCGVGDEYEKESVDQLQKVIDKLKTNPDDRRMLVSAWHPYWVDHCALPPCHVLFHFNTEELTDWERSDIARNKGLSLGITSVHEMNEKMYDEAGIPRRRLNCLLYQRSCDTGLGVPYNITSYALLTAMVAHCVGMEPGVFTHTYGDLHIYKNHVDQLKLQLTREPMKLPKLWLNPDIKNLFDFKYDDIKLVDYVSHPTIKMDIAV